MITMTRPTLIYKSEDMNLDLVEQAIQNIIKRGFGAAGPAITASDLNWKYLGREYAVLNGQDTLARFAEVKAYKYVDGEPQLCPAVMEIINKYFNTYRTKHNLYYAPKSTPAKRVYDWLNDDFIGTMENPA
jgi:hypothetical protein